MLPERRERRIDIDIDIDIARRRRVRRDGITLGLDLRRRWAKRLELV
jgi:hypothetical protein